MGAQCEPMRSLRFNIESVSCLKWARFCSNHACAKCFQPFGHPLRQTTQKSERMRDEIFQDILVLVTKFF